MTAVARPVGRDLPSIEGIAFPPEPWHLHGTMTVMLWLVPTAVMSERTPGFLSTIGLRGFTVVGTAWVSYDESGLLPYDELLAATPVLDGWVPRATVTDIWVDSPVSMAGGRALWGIPKGLARFGGMDGRSFSIGPDGEDGVVMVDTTDATATYRPRVTIPGRVPAVWTMAHDRDGERVVCRTAMKGSLSLGTGTMTADPAGRLSYLAGRRPFAAMQISDFELTFGS